MANVLSPLKLHRKNFGKIERIVDISNLIEMQKESYRRFLQKDVPPEARSEHGLHGVFKSVFPIKDFSGACSLEFVEYGLGDPKYDVDECQQRGMTFEVPMKIRVRLVVYETGDGSEVPDRPGHQGAGDLFRHPALDDRERHLHHQRHRAGGGESVAPVSGPVHRS